jgi:CheY-like chemotaxis protein
MTQPKVLAVDNSKVNLSIIHDVLSPEKLELHIATSVTAALELVQHHTFTLFILDVEMLDMNGLKLVTLFRSNINTRSVPIIFLTAQGKEVVAET